MFGFDYVQHEVAEEEEEDGDEEEVPPNLPHPAGQFSLYHPHSLPQSRFGTATRRRLLCIKCQVCLELAELSGLPKSSFSNCGPCCSCCCCCADVVVACFSLIFISFYFFLSCLLYFAFNNIFTLMLGHFGQRAAPHFLCVFMCRITEVDNLILCTEGLPVCTPLSSLSSPLPKSSLPA